MQQQEQNSNSSYQNWLRQVTQAYSDPNRTFRDVDQLLALYFPKVLQVKTDYFVREQLSSSPSLTQATISPPLLLCIFGLIPLNSMEVKNFLSTKKTSSFLHSEEEKNLNLPIEIWIPLQYPFQPPMVYYISSSFHNDGDKNRNNNPTSMTTAFPVIKKNGIIGNDGKIFHNFLFNWNLLNLYEWLNRNLTIEDLEFLFKEQYPKLCSINNNNTDDSFIQNHLEAISNTFLKSTKEIFSMLDDKLKKRFTLLHSIMLSKSEEQFSIESTLNERFKVLRERLSFLENFQSDLKNNIKDLERQIVLLKELEMEGYKFNDLLSSLSKEEEHDAEGSFNYSKIFNSPIPLIDELIQPDGLVSNQIITSIARDLSLQDTIYAIGSFFLKSNAFVNNRLDNNSNNSNNNGGNSLNSFLRIIRDLAREQFMARALLVKIRKTFPI